MKQMIKNTLAIVTLLLVSLGASAQTAYIIYKLDGVVQGESSAPGTVVVDFSTRTITVTPGSGNYLTADDLSAVKIVDGSLATTRNGEPGFNTPVAISAKDANADPSTTTEYTFADLGDDNYGLEVTANFRSRINISDATVSGLADSYTYTGEAIKPVVTVKVGDNTLTLNTDYRAVYTDSINASTDDVKGKITLSGLRKYTGTKEVEYIIAKADPTLTFAPATATITFGNEAAFEKPVLTKDPEDLAVTYQVKDGDDNVAQVNGANGDITPLFPGQATIEAVFAGNANYNEAKGQYTLTVSKGTAVVTVAPVAKDNLIYNGDDQELVNGGTATNGTMMYRIGTEGDFSAEIPKGNAAGKYTVYYKAVAINSDQFNDSEALSITATIKGKSIANATITLIPESFTYNGQNQKPEVSVKDGETDLVFDQDYTLTNDGGTNVGEYSVTVTGKGNYDSQTKKSANFNITALETTPTVTLTETSVVYDGTEKKPAVTVTVVLPGASASTELTTDDYEVAYSDNVNIGVNTAKATVTLKCNYVGQNNATFTITPKSIANATIILTPESFTYNGENQKPEVSVKDVETDLVLDQDYTLTNEGGTNVGEYTVTVTGKGNYDSETSVSKKFNITAGSMEVTAEGYEGTYDKAAHSIKVNAPEGATIKYGTVEGTYNLTEAPTYTNAGTYTIYYQVTKENYTTVTGSQTVTINKAAGAISYATATVNKTYGDEPFTNELTITGDGTVTYGTSNDKAATVNENGLVTIVGSGEATIKATVADKEGGNYTYATKTASYLVSVGTAAMEVTATAYTGTYDGLGHTITVNAPEGATIKYGTVEGTYNLTEAPTYTNAGTYTVFYQVTKENYTTVTGSQTVTINKAAGAISYATATVNKTYGDEPFTNELTITGDGTVIYGTSNDKAATVNANGLVTIVGSGEATIKATVADKEGGNYTYATKTASYLVSVGTAAMEVTATAYTGTYDGLGHTITVNAPEGATIKYGTVEGTYNLTEAPTYTNAGTYTVFYQVTKENYTTVTGSQTVTINKAAGAISYATATVNKTYGDDAFTNELTITGDGTVTYGTSNDKTATVNENGLVTIVGSGEATIKATVADKEGGNYTYATKTASYLISVGTAAMEVTATAYTGTYDGLGHTITVNAPNGATVKYGIAASTYNLDNAVKYTDAGYYTVYYQVTKANYTTVTGSQTVTINKAAGFISYTTTTINKTEGDAGFTNTLTNNGDGTVTYSSSDDKVAYVDANGYVTIVGPGSATITATVTDGTNYSYSTKTVSYTLTVEATVKERVPSLEELGFTEDGQVSSTFYSEAEDLILPENIAAYVITGINGGSVTTQRLSYIPKGVPVLLEKGASTQEPNDIITGNLLLGTANPLPIGNLNGTIYVLFNNMFVRTISGTIPAHRCYMIIDNAAGARSYYSISHGDDTTDVHELRIESEESREEWYDLQGRRIEKPTKKGLYIRNGKKIFKR